MTKFVPAIIAAAAMSTLAGCVAESGDMPADEAFSQDSELASQCPNPNGTNAAIAAFAAAYGTEAHQWQILNDFEEYRDYGDNYQMKLRPKSTGKCANNACPNTMEVLAYQSTKLDQKIVLDGQFLSTWNFASRLVTGYDNMLTYRAGNRYTFPAHSISMIASGPSATCTGNTDFTYSTNLSNPDVLVNALRFADGNGVNYHLFTYDAQNVPHLRTSGMNAIIDPTGGTSGDSSTSSSSTGTGTLAAGCQGYSADKVKIKVYQADGVTQTMVDANGYPCNCSLKNISGGKMRLDDPYAASTYFCRTQ